MTTASFATDVSIAAASPIRAIIVDDDVPARQRLRLLAERESDVTIVDECGDGREAVDALNGREVDLVFLDIEMPRLDGFGVLAELGAERMPPFIFTSAFSHFAVRAFEAYALDYLLKPFDDARFQAAVARARMAIAARRNPSSANASPEVDVESRLKGLLADLARPTRGNYPEAIAIRSGAHYVVVRVAEIDWIEADGNYAKLYVNQRPRLLTRTLAALEKEVLDPEVFVRVHRSAIVNTTKISSVEPLFHGELSLVLHDGTRVQCSRRFRKKLEERLYFTT